MKKAKLTFFVVVFLLLIIFTGFVSFTNSFSSKSENKKEKMDVNDKVVLDLQKLLLKSDDLRKAYLSVDTITDKEMLEYILISLEKDDYKVKRIRPDKITCDVANGIFFTSDNVCKIWIIDNNKIKEYEKKLFGTDRQLNYEEIEYHGMYCKNDSKKYYCLIDDYVENYRSYSLIDKAYRNKDEIYLYEFYLKVNLADQEDCARYYNNNYCSDYGNKDTPEIVADIVKKDGVYYRHVFERNEFNLYSLVKSEIVVK